MLGSDPPPALPTLLHLNAVLFIGFTPAQLGRGVGSGFGSRPRRSVLKPVPATPRLVPFFVDIRLFTLMARRLIGQLGTVIVSLLTNDLPFKHVYSLHINQLPAQPRYSAVRLVGSLKVSRSPHDALFSRPLPPPNTPRPVACRAEC